MNRFAGFFGRTIVCGRVLAMSLVLAGIVGWAWPPSANSGQEAAKPSDDASLLGGFRHVEAASVSDALEQISGHKMYMTHRMRPIFPTKFAGFALTVLLKKESNNDPSALTGMLAAINHDLHGIWRALVDCFKNTSECVWVIVAFFLQ